MEYNIKQDPLWPQYKAIIDKLVKCLGRQDKSVFKIESDNVDDDYRISFTCITGHLTIQFNMDKVDYRLLLGGRTVHRNVRAVLIRSDKKPDKSFEIVCKAMKDFDKAVKDTSFIN